MSLQMQKFEQHAFPQESADRSRKDDCWLGDRRAFGPCLVDPIRPGVTAEKNTKKKLCVCVCVCLFKTLYSRHPNSI